MQVAVTCLGAARGRNSARSRRETPPRWCLRSVAAFFSKSPRCMLKSAEVAKVCGVETEHKEIQNGTWTLRRTIKSWPCDDLCSPNQKGTDTPHPKRST